MAHKRSIAPNLITACDSRYSGSAANLIISAQKNSPIFDKYVVYDIGMKWWERMSLSLIEDVQVIKVPHFTKYTIQCWSWKTWVWKFCPGDKILYLDAGVEVMRNLEEVSQEIDESGYYLVSQSEADKPHTVRQITPSSYYDRYGVDKKAIEDKEVVAAGIIGFTKKSIFFKKVVAECYARVLDQDNIGWSSNEMNRNTGLHYIKDAPLQDCDIFRHDQTILNLSVYREYKEPIVHSMERSAGYRGREDHPEQLMWSHRLASDLPHIANATLKHSNLVTEYVYKKFARKKKPNS